jgi:hypothetical protein
MLPFFIFLTLVNNTSDPPFVRVALSLLHSFWWSLVISLVGSVLLFFLLALPALFLDVVL